MRKEIETFFDNVAPEYDVSHDDTNGYKNYMEKRRLIGIKHLSMGANQRLVDIGCGTGRLRRCFPLEAEYIGIDMSKEMLRIANTIGGIFVRGDFHFLPFRDGSFDTTLCLNSLQYTHRPGIVISESARVTKSGGRCIVSFINLMSVKGILVTLRNSLFHVKSIEHRFFISDMLHKANEAGFKLSHMSSAGILPLRSKRKHIPGELVRIAEALENTLPWPITLPFANEVVLELVKEGDAS